MANDAIGQTMPIKDLSSVPFFASTMEMEARPYSTVALLDDGDFCFAPIVGILAIRASACDIGCIIIKLTS